MAFTVDIDVGDRDATKVASLLRSVADRVEAGEKEGGIADGTDVVGEFSLEEDTLGEAGSEAGDQPADPANDPNDPNG